MYHHFHRHSTTIQRLWGKFNQTGCVYDIQQSPMSRVTTRGQNRYIVLNHIRVRWKSDTPTARQTNVFISNDQCIILCDHFELWSSVYRIITMLKTCSSLINLSATDILSFVHRLCAQTYKYTNILIHQQTHS